MLITLAFWNQVVQLGPADAHDAGFLGAMWHQLGPADAYDAGFLGTMWHQQARLMLMMLAAWGKGVHTGPADAHDGGFLGAMWHQLSPADAHVLASRGPCGTN